MGSSESARSDSLIDQAEQLIEFLEAETLNPSLQIQSFDLAAACHGRMLELENLDQLEAIHHAVAGARLIQALRHQGAPLPDWLDIHEEQLCRYGGMWIHERLQKSGKDPLGLGRQGVDLLRRLNQIHAGELDWINHQLGDLEQMMSRTVASPGARIHYAIQDHGKGATLPQLVRLLEGPGVSIDITLDGTQGDLEGVQRVLDQRETSCSLRRSSPVSWAGSGVYKETIAAMERALNLPDWSYFINCSGSCLPLGNSAWIQQVLEERKAQGWLGFCDSTLLEEPVLWISRQTEPMALKNCHELTAYDRVRWLADPCLKGMIEEDRIDPARKIEMRAALMYSEIEKNTFWVRPLAPKELRERATFLTEVPLRYGRNWIVLHRSIVEWLLGSTILQRVMQFLEGCFIGDELIFAMTLFSAENPYLASMYPDNLRHWQGGPQRISLEEIPTLLSEGDRLMVRKIAQDDYTAAAELVRGFNRP